MEFFRKSKKNQVQPKWKIKRECLELILESSKSTYPNEFGGLLRTDPYKKHTITEVVLLPGTVSGDSHAIFKLHMLPIDFSIVGTTHSHPSPYFQPSEADILLFRKYGKVHIVVAYPFTFSSWKGYDYDGKEIDVEIV